MRRISISVLSAVLFSLNFLAFQNCSKFSANAVGEDSLAQTQASDADPLVQTFSDSAQPQKIVIRDRHYAPSISKTPEMTLDLVYDDSQVRPLVVFVHGGGWHDGDKGAGWSVLGDTFFNRGYAFAAINYRLLDRNEDGSPKKNFVEDIPKDIARALLFLKNNASDFKLDFSKITLIGHSAGAHLSALTLSNPAYLDEVGISRSSIAGLVLLDGHVYDIPVLAASRPIIGKMVGGPAKQQEASPAVLVRGSPNLVMPPVFLLYGPNSNVHVNPLDTEAQALIFRSALVENGSSYVWTGRWNMPHGDFLKRLFNIGSAIADLYAIDVMTFVDRVNVRIGTTLADEAVFDWQSYLGFNPKLVEEGIRTAAGAKDHWIKHGLNAGRQASARFSADSYLSKNPAVALRYSTDRVGAALHYIKTGKAAGLDGMPDSRIYGVALPNARGEYAGDAVIGNENLKIVTSSKYSGAIEQLWYRNTQMVDDGAYAYGRLFQMAGWKYGLAKCFNPIEAGSRYYDTNTFKSSVLNTITATASGLFTRIQPALFRRLSDDDCNARDQSPLGSYLPQLGQINDPTIRFEKSISFSDPTNPRLIRFEGTVVNQALIDVPGNNNISPFIVQLYAALKTDFRILRTVNFEACTSMAAIDTSACNLIQRAPNYSISQPAVVSRADGLSFAMYSTSNTIPQNLSKSTSPASYIAKRHLDGSDNDVVDTAVNFVAREALPAGTFHFTIYIMVGPEEQVRRDLIKMVLAN